ncbi:MAG: hypothetical protein JNN03_01835 [Rubrivivax sp.]|nr:hypothetical protein [Rubrivivax sp.]
MYWMLRCEAPIGSQPALPSYYPDDMGDGELRSWKSARRFPQPPPSPIEVHIDEGESGLVLELYDANIALMSGRLAAALKGAGVTNVDFYSAVVIDHDKGTRHLDHVAFNVVGAIALADLRRSTFSAHDGLTVSVDFDRLVLAEARARGALFFRLAESVNGIVVHQRVRDAVLAAGIDTLAFGKPENWVG